MRKAIKLPGVDWKERFRAHSLRTGFTMHLTQPMLELLCAIADDVQWDASRYNSSGLRDSIMVTAACLEKRGLIEHKREPEKLQVLKENIRGHERSYWQCTPGGKAVVQMLKMAGLFVEADAAVSKKAKRKA